MEATGIPVEPTGALLVAWTRDELDAVIRWLTGYDQSEVDRHLAAGSTLAVADPAATMVTDDFADEALVRLVRALRAC